MDPEQTAPMEQSDLGPHCLPWRLLKHFSRREKADDFCCDWRIKGLERN